jgi:hypothetical protein
MQRLYSSKALGNQQLMMMMMMMFWLQCTKVQSLLLRPPALGLLGLGCAPHRGLSLQELQGSHNKSMECLV